MKKIALKIFFHVVIYLFVLIVVISWLLAGPTIPVGLWGIPLMLAIASIPQLATWLLKRYFSIDRRLPALVALAVLGTIWVCYPLLGFGWRLATRVTEPPQFLRAEMADAKWGRDEETSRKLQAFFEREFPPGSNAKAMIGKLQSEGFRFAELPNLPCFTKGQSAPIGVMHYECFDPNKRLEFAWGNGFFCGATIYVTWSTDYRGVISVETVNNGAITEIKASYYSACL